MSDPKVSVGFDIGIDLNKATYEQLLDTKKILQSEREKLLLIDTKTNMMITSLDKTLNILMYFINQKSPS